MSDAFKPTKIGLFGICPEITQGTPNWDLTADGGSNGGTVTSIDTTSGTTHNNALASMANDDLNRLFIYFRPDTATAALQGKLYEVTDSAIAGGVVSLTTGTMAATPAGTDRFVLFAPIPASDVSNSVGYENLPRIEFERQTLDMPTSNKGLQVASGSFNWELCGLEQENGNGDTPRIDRFGQLLKAVGARRSVAGTTVSGSGSTTTVLDVTSAASLAVNDWVLVGGEASRITAVDTVSTPDNITVSPALSSAPADTTEVFVGEVCTPDDTGHQSHTVLTARDTQLLEIRGCVFSFGASGSYGQNLEASAEFDGEAWDLQDTYTLDGQQSTKKAIPYVAGRSFFGSTALGLSSFEWSLGHGRQQLRDTAAGQRQFITTRDATCGVNFRNQDATPKETWEASGTHDWLVVQVGNAAGGCVVFAGKAQVQDPAEMADVEGHQYWDATFAFRDDQTDYSTPNKPVIVRF